MARIFDLFTDSNPFTYQKLVSFMLLNNVMHETPAKT